MKTFSTKICKATTHTICSQLFAIPQIKEKGTSILVNIGQAVFLFCYIGDVRKYF